MTHPEESELNRISRLAHQEEYDEALRVAAELKGQYPRSAKVHRQMSYVFERMSQLEHAIRETSEAIALDSGQPDYYFTRGRLCLEVGRYSDTIADCTRAIELGEQHDWQYYFSAACFVRALAKVRAGDAHGALEDCAALPDDTIFWALGGAQTKTALVAELKRLLGRS